MLTAKWFDEHYYQEHKAYGLDYLAFGDWQRERAKWLVQTFGLDKSQFVLDYGCACGALAEGVRQLIGNTVYGIDPSEYMINLGRKQFPNLQLVIGSDLRMFGNDSLDFVYSIQVMEHLLPHTVPSFFIELNRVCRGMVFLAFDTERREPEAIPDPTHTCMKPRIWWVEMSKEHGFEVFDCPGRDNWDILFLRRK